MGILYIMIRILKIDMGLYEHWALESESTYNGKPTLISNTQRNGHAQEEAWDKVVNGRPFKRISIKTNEPAQQIIDRARSSVGRVKYNFFSYNCEHFIRELLTGVAESKQLQKAAIGIAAIGLLYALIRKP